MIDTGMPDGGYGQNSPFQDPPQPKTQNLNNAILQKQQPTQPNTGVSGAGFPTDPSLVSFRNPSNPRQLGDPHVTPPAPPAYGGMAGLGGGIAAPGMAGQATGGLSSGTPTNNPGLMSAITGGQPAPGMATGQLAPPSGSIGNSAPTSGLNVDMNDPVQAAVMAAYQKKGITPGGPSGAQTDFDYWVNKLKTTNGGWSNPDNQTYWNNRMAQTNGGVGAYDSPPESASGGPQLMALPSSQPSPLLAAIMQSLQKPASH